MSDKSPLRSALFVPADKPRAQDKAKALPADALILDLEDAVAEDAKAEARDRAITALSGWKNAGKRAVLRINAASTAHFSGDCGLCAGAQPDAVLLPKIDDAASLKTARDSLDAAGYRGPLWAMIETPLAVLNLKDIGAAARSARLETLVAGTNDLAMMLRLSAPSRQSLGPHLAQIVLAGRAHFLAVLDGVYNNYIDIDGFSEEAREGRRMGFDGKTLIHPSQIEPAHTAFAPSAEEIEWAQRVVALFNLEENAHKGAATLDGAMVERLHLDAARAILAAAEPDGES